MTEPPRPPDDPLAQLGEIAARVELRHPPPDPRETLDDTGDAYRFARLVGDTVRWVPAYDCWYVWDGKRLLRDELGLAFHHTLAVSHDLEHEAVDLVDDDRARWLAHAAATRFGKTRREILRCAATLPELATKAELLDVGEHLLNTPDGVLDLKTLTLLDHDIQHLITRQTRARWQPELTWTPLLQEYQQTFMPDIDEWHHTMKILGSCLRGGNNFRIWPIMHGRTTSGKTQLVETIAHLLGDYAVSVNTSVFRANQDDKPRPDLLKALTARFVYADEGSHHWDLHADHVQRLTGQSVLTARGMRSNIMVERVPSFTPLIVCNEYPQVKDAGAPLLRRLRVIEFQRSIAGVEDAGKREEFMHDEDTLSALLTQLVLGCYRAYGQGMTDTPQAWVTATAAAFDALNHLSDFIEYMKDCGALVEVDAKTTPAARFWAAGDLYGRYRVWAEMHLSPEDRRTMYGSRQFSRALRDRGWETVASNGTRWSGKLCVTPYVTS